IGDVPPQIHERHQQPARERHVVLAARAERASTLPRGEARFTLGLPDRTDLGDQPRELSARHTRELTDLTLGQQRRTTRRHSSHAHILARASTIQRQFYYLDPGREELPEDAIKWMDDLRRTFSDLLLAAMGMPKPGWEFEG